VLVLTSSSSQSRTPWSQGAARSRRNGADRWSRASRHVNAFWLQRSTLRSWSQSPRWQSGSTLPTGDGGRETPLLGGYAKENRFTYRPNWGLPGWTDGDQTAGPVLGFSRTNIRPGEQVRAVLVPLFLDHAPGWLDVEPGDMLRMYEGARVCGHGPVRWVEITTWRMPEEEQDRLVGWLSKPDALA